MGRHRLVLGRGVVACEGSLLFDSGSMNKSPSKDLMNLRTCLTRTSGFWPAIGRFCLGPLCVAVAPGLSWANGTPIDRSDVNATGNIRMIREANISLEEEMLRIVMEGDWATVRAEYHLMNRDAGSTVAYGFPIDYMNPASCNDCDEPPEEDKVKAGKPLRDVRIEVDGEAMTIRELTEPASTAAEPPPSLRTWLITDLTFGAAQRRVVTVTYRVRNRLDDWAWSNSFVPAFSPRQFRYLLSPSGNWGDGRVPKLAISIDISALKEFGATIKTIKPAGYTSDDDVLRWQFVNYDLGKAPDLEIEYDDDARLLSQYVAQHRLLAPRLARARASSTLVTPTQPERHDISKMFDGDLDTAWCEGAADGGAGQTLTFEFRSAGVAAIGIVNGYTKNQDVFQGNGRIRRLHATAVHERETRQVSATLPQRELRQLNRRAIAPFIDWLDDISPLHQYTSKIELTIADVHPGARHSDTCISEIYFVDFSE
jgi:hypothetical protein